MLKLYPIVFTNLELIEYQLKSFKKNLLQEFEFTPILNTPSPDLQQQAVDICNSLGLKHIVVQNPRHDVGGLSHQRAVEFVLQSVIPNDPVDSSTIIMDADIFLILPTNVDELVCGDFKFCGLNQGTNTHNYLWVGLFIFKNDAPNLGTLDLRGAMIDREDKSKFVIPDHALGWTWDDYGVQIQTMIPLDSGGMFCKYQYENPSVQVNHLSLGFVDREGGLIPHVIPEHMRGSYNDAFRFWLIGDRFLHTGRISNWDFRPEDEIISKNKFIKELIEYYTS